MAKSKVGAAANGLGQPKAFTAEVAKLLRLMVDSVYSDRDVFLRELISNGSDALDKLRYAAIANPALLEDEPVLSISLAADKKVKTLKVIDNGIGMSAEELAENLGTIARSGTEAFLKDAKDAPDLIGKFGIGFYAAFMVAEKVDVVSRKAGTDKAYRWSSDGLGTYTITAEDKAPRGTSITLHLKKDAETYLDTWKIESVVKAYSDHIAHPINLVDGDTTRQLNSASALWARPKADVSAEQHKEFFQSLSHSSGEPALTLHYKAEGRHEYNVLFYVPAERPFDLYDPVRQGRQKLYVRRVFIADDANLLPPYLRFIRGVVDSNDMPLNLSREMLQNNPDVVALRKALTNRVIAELKKCAEKDEATFRKIWEVFAPVIKEGLYEDFERREQIMEFARFRSTKSPWLTLKDYVEGMKENQTSIYYITGEDAAKAEASPQLEGFKSRDIEVLVLTDPVDSFWVRTAMGFNGKPFVSVAQGASGLDAIKPATEKSKPKEVDPALAKLTETIKAALADKVTAVRVSERLTESPVCLVSDAALDRNLERLLSRQKDSGVTVSAPALEINGTHPVISSLLARQAAGADISDEANLLLGLAHVLEGEPVPDPQVFAKGMTKLLVAS